MTEDRLLTREEIEEFATLSRSLYAFSHDLTAVLTLEQTKQTIDNLTQMVLAANRYLGKVS